MKKLLIVFVLTFWAWMAFGEERPLTESQEIVAMTILGEARGEGEAGMYAVACVISQRCIEWNKKPKNVCLKTQQFSCWNNRSDIAITRMHNLLYTKEGEYAKRLAVNLYSLDRGYVKNADHYCTLKTQNYWTKGQKRVATIGNHKFFKLR
jgi:spore germination cell wall hydrolase CwlJ-like protein